MKYIISLLIMLTLSMSSFAEVKREGNNFRVEQTLKESDIKTNYTWEDKKGNKYPIFITKRGACYVVRTSKNTGKEYKYYLPKDIQETIKRELGYGTKI